MFISVFVCIGFMLAVLYIDLMFDVMAVPHRRSGRPLPKEVLIPIIHYYGRITQNPYVLMFVMLTTAISLVFQIAYHLAPRWMASLSLVLLTAAIAAAGGRVIPTARRLASAKDSDERQTRLVHRMFPAHVVLLVCILLLAAIQLAAARTGVP